MKAITSADKASNWAMVSSMLGNTPETIREAMVKNVMRVFESATASEIQTGKAWYSLTRDFCIETATFNGLENSKGYVNACGCVHPKDARRAASAQLVAAVVSALSPLNQWARNKTDAASVTACFVAGADRDAVKVCTFGANKKRAFAILDNSDASIVQTSRKTRAFQCNITNASSDCVTIDFHAFSIAVNYRYTGSSMPSVKDGLYADVQSAYREATRRINAGRKGRKLRPYQLQAITWLAWRRLVDVHSNAGTV